MHERTGTRRGGISLQLSALITIAGAIFLNTAPYIGLLTNTPKSDETATVAEAPPARSTPAARVVAHAEEQTTSVEGVATARVRSRDASSAPGTANAPEPAPTREEEKSVRAEAEVMPLPQSAPERGLAILIPPVPPLPAGAPKEVPSRIVGSPLQQTGRASWYALDSLTASGEKLDDAALTAAHNNLPFGTKVQIENIANGRSVMVRINDRGPFVTGRIVDLSKAAAEALDMIAEGVADVRLSVIYDAVASAGGD